MKHPFPRFTPSTAFPFLLLSLLQHGDCSSITTNCTILVDKDSSRSVVTCNYNQDLSVIGKELVVYHFTPNFTHYLTKTSVLECKWNASQKSQVLECSGDNMPKELPPLSNFSIQFNMSDIKDLGEYKCQTRPHQDPDIFETCLIIKQNILIPSNNSTASNNGTDAAVVAGVSAGVAIFLIFGIMGIAFFIWYRRKKVRTGHPTACTEDPHAEVNGAEHPLLLSPPSEVVCGPGSGDPITRQDLVPSQAEIKSTGKVKPTVINQSLGSDITDSSCKAVSEQWTADKESILSDCGNLTESSNEHEVDRCILECRKLECECTIYLDQSNAFGDCADLSKEELSYIERLSGRAVTEQKRLASLQRTVLRKTFMSKIKVIKQQNDRPQEIENFVQEVQQTCKGLWDEDISEELQLDLSRHNLKKLLSKDLVRLLQEVQELQVNFETSLSEAVARLVLREITKGQSNKEDVTDQQLSDDVHVLARRMSLIIIDPENGISVQEDGIAPEEQKE